MQKKWTIFAIALVALSSILIVHSISMDTDADGSGDGNVTYSASLNYGADTGIPRTLHLILNENYFQNIDNNHVMEWYYFDSSDYVPIVFSADSGKSNEVTIKQGDTSLFKFYLHYLSIGKYDLVMESLNNSVSMTTQLKLRCDVMITIQDGEHFVRQYYTDPMLINVNISLNNANDLPTSLGYTINDTPHSIESFIYITEGEPVSMIPVIAASYPASQYYWYAVNLPVGMAMTGTGIISGVPIQPSSGDITPTTVYVEDGFGNGKTFTVMIWVTEKTVSLSFYLLNGIIDANTDLSGCVHEPTQFFTQRGKTVSMAIQKTSASETMTVSVVKIDEGSSEVKRSNITGTAVTINGIEYIVYSLPTDGTGTYRVDIRDSSKVLQDRFDFFVMSKLLAVESAIIVGSDSTS